MEDTAELERKVRREADSFWFQEMVLEPNHDFMLTFFADCEETLSFSAPTADAPTVDEEKLRKATIKDFNNQFYNLRRRVSEFECVTAVSEKIQNLMTDALDLESAFKGSLMQKKTIDELSEQRLAFFREI